ncbi:MAG: hypothetical protein PSV40_02075 [Polaromonas sp.]|uniref:hypothetical protein n=1 Tax=Polaromonas sp. TaxID=1869339 RepID=UPI0024876970|nr:hypothetical protein [Polaromonas sp.]MDI1267876.1 hypothetical protein [Polaromonas sp.]
MTNSRSASVPMLALVASAILLSGCATHYSADVVRDPFGFFSGIWHGMIFPISVVVNFLSWMLGLLGLSFLESIQIIGRPNTGVGYYIGFVVGLTVFGGGTTRR